MSARTAIRDWSIAEARSQMRWSIAGVVGCLLGGGLALFLMFWILYFFMGFFFGTWLTTAWSLKLAVTLIIALVFVAYFLVDFGKLENFQFESKSRLQGARTASRLMGGGFLSLAAGPKTAMSFVKVIALIVLSAPGLVALSVRLCLRAVGLRKIDPNAVSRALLQLLRLERKIACTQLENKSSLTLEELLDQLRMFEGVVIRGKKSPEIYLTEGLRQELVAAVSANADKKSHAP